MFELIDPSSPLGDVLDADTMETIRTFVGRCNDLLTGDEEIRVDTLEHQLGMWRRRTLSMGSKREIQGNLLKYFHDLYNDEATLVDGEWSEVFKLARLVFTQPIVSVVIETLFSQMSYAKSKYRSSTGDDNVFASLVCKDYESIHANPREGLHMPELNMGKPLEHKLKWRLPV